MIASLKRSLWVGISVVAAVGVFLVPLVASQQKASAISLDGYVIDGKVTICHRDNNAMKPYGPKAITVSVNAVNGEGKNDHSSHTGPLASSQAVAQGLKNGGTKWGDIIPPIPGYPGLNWTAVGQAMWNNNCQFAKVATAAVSVTPATCESGAVLQWGETNNATFSGTPDGTVGPAPYAVTATAHADSLFSNTYATMAFSGTLSGHLTGEGCETPTEPTIATAGVKILPATCKVGQTLVYTGVTHATAAEGSTKDGATGPLNYSVTFTANEGSTFDTESDATTMNFKGTLQGPSTAPNCEQGDVLGDTTPPAGTPKVTAAVPTQLPKTGSDGTSVIALGGSLLVVLAGIAGARRFLTRGL